MSRKTHALRAAEREGIQLAAAAGLFVLFEGPRRRRVWRLYSKTSGRCLGYWLPSTGVFHFDDSRVRAAEARDAINIAVGSAA